MDAQRVGTYLKTYVRVMPERAKHARKLLKEKEKLDTAIRRESAPEAKQATAARHARRLLQLLGTDHLLKHAGKERKDTIRHHVWLAKKSAEVFVQKSPEMKRLFHGRDVPGLYLDLVNELEAIAKQAMGMYAKEEKRFAAQAAHLEQEHYAAYVAAVEDVDEELGESYRLLQRRTERYQKNARGVVARAREILKPNDDSYPQYEMLVIILSGLVGLIVSAFIPETVEKQRTAGELVGLFSLLFSSAGVAGLLGSSKVREALGRFFRDLPEVKHLL